MHSNADRRHQQPEGTADAEASALPEMTTDEITLTYMHFDNEQLVNAVADAFMAKYPNIKVETQAFSTDGYNDTLLNLVQSGQMPDCFMILGNCDFALSNALLGDMTPYWENDPENENILPSINNAKLDTMEQIRSWQLRSSSSRMLFTVI